MKGPRAKLLSWLLGVAGLAGIIWYYRPPDFFQTIASLGMAGVMSWLFMIMISRIAFVETTVEPLNALGYHLKRSDAFWISWIRTFANQIVPFSGAAAYAQALRKKALISWPELAALATPQIVLSAAALGIIGLLAVFLNLDQLAGLTPWLGTIYISVIVMAIAIVKGSAWLVESLPDALSSRAQQTTRALRRLSRHPYLIPRLIGWYASLWLLGGGRLWILFSAAGVDLNWKEMLLMIAIAESAMLIQVTPGSLGVREGAVLGAAAILGIEPPVAAAVAVIDRLFLFAITALMAIPGFAILAGKKDTGSTH